MFVLFVKTWPCRNPPKPFEALCSTTLGTIKKALDKMMDGSLWLGHSFSENGNRRLFCQMKYPPNTTPESPPHPTHGSLIQVFVSQALATGGYLKPWNTRLAQHWGAPRRTELTVLFDPGVQLQILGTGGYLNTSPAQHRRVCWWYT
jgi:hypothetical protein